MTDDKPDEEKLTEVSESQAPEHAEPKEENTSETELSNRKKVEAGLQKRIDAGLNLSEKSVYVDEFKAIASENNVSYTYVAKIAKTFLKKSKSPESKTVISESSKIKIKTVDKTERPPRKEQLPTLTSNHEGGGDLMRRALPLDNERRELEIKLESGMIEMSFESIASIEKMLGIPYPQAKKIKKIADLIATFNQRCEEAGKPDQKIEISERLLPLFIKLSIFSMFAVPIMDKIMKSDFMKPKDKGIESNKKLTNLHKV